jgi:hypothetical protein
MIEQTSGNGKIIKRVLVDGDISHTFKVVKNQRVNGHPTHKTLAKIGCFRKSYFTADAEKFWTIADEKLSALVDAGVLWLTDKTKIEKQFEAVIPRRPALPVKYWVTKNPPKTTRV